MGIRLEATIRALEEHATVTLLELRPVASPAPDSIMASAAAPVSRASVPLSGPPSTAWRKAQRILDPDAFLSFPDVRAGAGDALSAAVESVGPDAIHLHHPYPLANLLTRWPRCTAEAPLPWSLVIDMVDVMSATRKEQMSTRSRGPVLTRIIQHAEYLKLRRLERRFARIATALVVSTEAEKVRARHLDRGDINVVPNTVDCERWRPPTPGEATSSDDGPLLMTGDFAHGINSDGGRFFLDKVWPILRRMVPQARVWFAGGRPPADFAEAVADAGGEMFASVDDTRPLLEKAAACIAPITHGGGTPYKIIEAMAMARPVVATPAAVRGFVPHQPEGVIVATTPEEFAASCASLLKSPALRVRLGGRGREFVEQHHDHRTAARLWTRLYLMVEHARRG